MNICPKCGPVSDDNLSGFCRSDGMPLVNISKADANRQENQLDFQQLRRLESADKWKRVIKKTAVYGATLFVISTVVSVIVVNTTIFKRNPAETSAASSNPSPFPPTGNSNSEVSDVGLDPETVDTAATNQNTGRDPVLNLNGTDAVPVSGEKPPAISANVCPTEKIEISLINSAYEPEWKKEAGSRVQGLLADVPAGDLKYAKVSPTVSLVAIGPSCKDAVVSVTYGLNISPPTANMTTLKNKINYVCSKSSVWKCLRGN